MEFEKALQELNITSGRSALEVEWDESERSFPQEIFFLTHAFLNPALAEIFPGRRDIAQALHETARKVQANEALRRLAWHEHYLIIQNRSRFLYRSAQFPILEILGEHKYAYFLLLALSGYHYLGDIAAARGIPLPIQRASYDEFLIWIEECKERTGEFGVVPLISSWSQGILRGELIRLGRLSFQLEKFASPALVLRHKSTGALAVLAEAKTIFDAAGFAAEANTHPDGTWESALQITDAEISGNPISEGAVAAKTEISFSRQDWESIAERNDPVLGVHIAKGLPLDVKECAAAYAMARDFFRIYFPETRFRGFTCASWLLDPVLAKILEPTSNIWQFQARMRQVPCRFVREAICIDSIFGADANKLAVEDLPAKTSLQERVKAHLSKGGRLRHGIGFIPID